MIGQGSKNHCIYHRFLCQMLEMYGNEAYHNYIQSKYEVQCDASNNC